MPATTPAESALDAAVIERLANELFREAGWNVEGVERYASVPVAPASAPAVESPDAEVPLAPTSSPPVQSPDVEQPLAPLSAPVMQAPPVEQPLAPASAPAASAPASAAAPAAPVSAPAPSVPAAAAPEAPSAAPTGYYFIDEAASPFGSAPSTLDYQLAPAYEPAMPAAPAPGVPAAPAEPAVAPDTLSVADRPAAPAYTTQPDVPQLEPTPGPLDVAAVRREFPILRETVHGHRLVWLDSGATSQKPQAVIDRVSHYYAHENSNVHRAAHELAARATNAYEEARHKVAQFVNASSPDDIVWVRGATEGVNLVAASWGRKFVKAGDEILVSNLEHHANIVPWQMLAAEVGARIVVIPVDDAGNLRLDEYERLLSSRTRLVACTMVSNALGTVTPAHEIVASAHRRGARVLLDAAQGVPHMRVDAQALDADFIVFSGHKMYAPMGIGAVYGKPEALAEMPPWQGGGNMIADVTFEKTVYQPPPSRFEAGTGSIGDAVGLGAAVDWMNRIGIENIARHEHVLMHYALGKLAGVPGLRFIGAPAERAGVISFVLDGYDAPAVGEALNRRGVAVRAGHHCAQPILRRMGVEATVRPSFAAHNDYDDIDELYDALRDITARKGL